VRTAGWSEVRPAADRRLRALSGAVAAGLALGGGVLLGACGDDREDRDGGDGGGARSGARADEAGPSDGAGPGRAEPEATDPEVVEPYLEDLMARHDQVVNQLNASPEVAGDRDDLLVQEYLHLFEPGSDFVEGALDAWVAQGEDGISIRPYDDEHAASRTRLAGPIEVVSPDEVRAPFCLEQRQRTYRDGELAQGLPLLERPGEVVAVRVEGEWRLRASDLLSDRTGCGQEARP
jgi:hypothetical protein